MSIDQRTAHDVIERVFGQYGVELSQAISVERLATAGEALRGELVQAGADETDLGGVLALLVKKIDDQPGMTTEQKEQNITAMCAAFRFEVETIPNGPPDAARHALKPRPTH